jgi:iron complex outermembrane receptor protein
LFSSLRLRASWGRTGNQEFPAGAATERYRYNGPGSVVNVNIENPDLKWESSTMTNVGIDFGVMNNRLTGTIDYFNKTTKDLLFRLTAVSPAPEAFYWTNLPGNILNSGFEFALNYEIIRNKDFTLSVGGNISFLKNELRDFPENLLIETGEINGQGLTGARAQRLANNQPLSVFWMGRFLGLDRNGIQQFEGGDPNNPANRFFAGSPNPKSIYGLTVSAAYKKLSFSANMFGASGHFVYNNTVQATLAVGNIRNNRNLAQSVLTGDVLEDPSQAQPVSDRFLEKGNYLRLGNSTLSYALGSFGKTIKNATVYITGQNLFIITKYSGFDPEVNTPKAVDEVPSFGIEYTPYPTARSFVFGINFSL